MSSSLLSPKLLRQLEQLELTARRRSRSAGRGERRSKARGHSVEFADHRNYVAGDDLRYLDWNLYGRLDRLFVKLYEEERELPVQVFLDASESMRFGTPSKFEFARQVAAAIGYVALCGFDRVSVRVFPEPDRSSSEGGAGAGAGLTEGQGAIRAGLRGIRGKRMGLTFLNRLTRVQPGGAAVFNEALKRAALEVRQPGLAMVLSDLLDPAGYAPGLDALIGRGFHVHVLQILAPEELNPDQFGDLRLVDSETGSEEDVTFGKFRLKTYRRIVESYTQKLREYCRGRGIGFYRATSDISLDDLLLKELRVAGVLG